LIDFLSWLAAEGIYAQAYTGHGTYSSGAWGLAPLASRLSLT
jgi:hypothetical protein